jgi:hypothetical protein
MLAERDRQVQSVQSQLDARDKEARQLQQEETALQQQFASAQANITNLNQQLLSSSSDAQVSKAKLAEQEAAARKQAAQLQDQLAQLSRSNQIVLTEKQQLSTQLQVATAERNAATEKATYMQEQVKVERQEKAKLAEGVQALATKSDALTQELRDNRPLAPNTIFNDFLTNRVLASFAGTHPGFLGGDSTKRKESETVLVSDGTHKYLLCHVQDTPLTLMSPGTEWQELTGTFSRDAVVPIHSLSFHLQDPRVVFMPVSDEEAAQIGSRPYRISADPYKFQDAVLVDGAGDYYGECKFEIDTSAPQYVKLDRNVIKGLFGKFNPSKGDYVFSRTGELLGVMVNSTYCLMLTKIDAATTVQFGHDVRAQHTGDTLARLYAFTLELPFKLQ